jgi:transglutaminase-like putative cysteine protease
MSPAPLLRVRVGCEFAFEASFRTPLVVQVLPRLNDGHTVIRESRRLEPLTESRDYVDQFGNRCWRLTVPEGGLTMNYDAIVEVSAAPDPIELGAEQVPIDQLPDSAMVYLLPSRYVQSDALMNAAWELFAGTPTGWPRVQAIVDWIHQRIQYRSASTTASTSALDVFLQRYGVCRDFAHMGVAMCRAMSIPARYVFGYLPDIGNVPTPGPMDFHSWFEAYLGGRWHTFDARHNEPRIARIPIGRGRDAVDVALVTQFGAAQLVRMHVWSDEVTNGSNAAADD